MQTFFPKQHTTTKETQRYISQMCSVPCAHYNH